MGDREATHQIGRLDGVARAQYWDICIQNRLESSEKWFDQTSESVVESEDVKILYRQTDKRLEHNHPEIGADLPTPKTWKSGYCEKKPRKIGRLGSQTGRILKYT